MVSCSSTTIGCRYPYRVMDSATAFTASSVIRRGLRQYGTRSASFRSVTSRLAPAPVSAGRSPLRDLLIRVLLLVLGLRPQLGLCHHCRAVLGVAVQRAVAGHVLESRQLLGVHADLPADRLVALARAEHLEHEAAHALHAVLPAGAVVADG